MNPFATGAGEPRSILWTPLREPARWVFAAAAATAGVAHVPVIGPHLAEAPYMGEEFIVLTVACLLLAVAAVVCDSAAVWLLGAVTCGLAVAGYAATRLVAFPGLSDDVGNWFEPLGVLSVAAECIVVVTCAWVAMRQRHRGCGCVWSGCWLRNRVDDGVFVVVARRSAGVLGLWIAPRFLRRILSYGSRLGRTSN